MAGDNAVRRLYDPGWEDFFASVSNELDNIEEVISSLCPKQEGGISLPAYFPARENIYRFTAIAPDSVKAVIVGMEPYSSYTVRNGIVYPEATGRSFEVASVSSWQQKFRQSSLRNILKAIYVETTGDKEASLEDIREKIRTGGFAIPEPHEWFDLMENRGVMFLNTALTVRPSETGSHMKLWAGFADALIRYIARMSPDALWLLFGKDAQDRILPVLGDNRANVSMTCHPRLPKFVYEEPFKRLNRKFGNLIGNSGT